MKIISGLTVAAVMSCAAEVHSAACRQVYTDERRLNATAYEFNPHVVSQDGVYIDDSGNHLDPLQVDLLFSEVEECTGQYIYRCGIGVKIADDWIEVPPYGQVFPCGNASETELCYGIAQEPGIVVVTPDLAALKHEILHYLITSEDDHEDETFKRCEK
jgi:hypothetical protein